MGPRQIAVHGRHHRPPRQVRSAHRIGPYLSNVEQKPRPIGQRAAIGIGPVVNPRAQELREQVAVGGVQLDAIECNQDCASAPRRNVKWQG